MFFIATVHMYLSTYVLLSCSCIFYVKERFVMFSDLTTYTSIKVKILQISFEGHRQHTIHVHGLIETIKLSYMYGMCFRPKRL